MFRPSTEQGEVVDETTMHHLTRRQFLLGSAAVSLTAAAALATPIPARAVALGFEGAQYHNFKRVPRSPVFTVSPAFGHPFPLIAWQEEDPLAPTRFDGGPLEGEQHVRVVAISGVPHATASRGVAGSAHVAAVLEADDPDRLTAPLKRTGPRGSGQYQAASWEEALGLLAPKLAATRPEATAILTGPRAPAELWRRFAHTLKTHPLTLGVDAGRAKVWQKIWGVDAPVADVARSGLVLNFGSNFLLNQTEWGGDFMRARTQFGTRLISVDPRLSRTAAASDRWVPLRPGSDGLLARALAAQMVWNEVADVAAAARLGGLDADELSGLLDDTDLDAIAEATGLPVKTLEALGDEVSRIRPLTVIAGAGVAAHSGGSAAERWIALLALLAGSLEKPGGLAQSRSFELGVIEPLPPVPKGRALPAEQLPWQEQAFDMLFLHEANPAFDQPAADVWRSWLKDETKVATSVAIATRRSESTDLCDWILPEAHWLERYEAVSGKATLLPWVAARQPARTPPGEARPVAVILRDAMTKASPVLATKYWYFETEADRLTPQLDPVEGLEDEGGWQAVLAKVGVWPLYGRFDPKSRQILDADGYSPLPVFPEASPKMTLGALPEWEPLAEVAEAGSLTLIVHEAEVGEGDVTANHKLIAEQQMANHAQINPTAAKPLGIEDGDLIRVVSAKGFLVSRARLTQTIHPEVVAMHSQGGHWSGGTVASGSADPELREEHGPINTPDADLAHNLWWSDRGVHPMDLLVPHFDPETGLAARSTPVRIEKAVAGDRYGQVTIGGEG